MYIALSAFSCSLSYKDRKWNTCNLHFKQMCENVTHFERCAREHTVRRVQNHVAEFVKEMKQEADREIKGDSPKRQRTFTLYITAVLCDFRPHAQSLLTLSRYGHYMSCV